MTTITWLSYVVKSAALKLDSKQILRVADTQRPKLPVVKA